MASLSELASVMSTSPAGAFRAEDTAYQQYQLQQQGFKEIQAEQAAEAKGLAGMTGVGATGAGGQQLGQMALDPFGGKFNLKTADGEETLAGQASTYLQKANTEQQLFNKAQQRAKIAGLTRDVNAQSKAMEEARRADAAMTEAKNKAATFKQEGTDALVYNATLAKSQAEYDAKVKAAMERAGLKNRPSWLPEKWSPDLKDEILPRASQKTAETIQTRIDRQNEELRRQEDQKFQRNREYAREKEMTGILGAIVGKEYADVKGQVEGLRAFLPDDRIKRLSGKEIPKVSSTVQSIRATSELADLVEKHPQSTGVPAQIINSFERYLPSRYEKDEEGAVNESKILNDVEKSMKAKNASQDEINWSRAIAKKVLDVVNERALAASGGGRLLISELNRQAEVLKSSGLTPESAPFVYRELARGDLDKLQSRYGIKPEEIKGMDIKKSEEVKPAESKAPDVKGQATTAFGSYEPEKYEYGINPATGKFARRPKGQ